MQAVKEKYIEKVTVTIDADKIDENIATDISTIVSSHPGKVALYFQLLDRIHNTAVMLRMPNQGIELTKELIEYIEANEDMNYAVN